MDAGEFSSLIDELSDSISQLEHQLKPLLESSVRNLDSKLPLLDKAKLHVLVAYSVESLLFSSLRLSGVDAKKHPVFTELTRVKQYFEKIKEAEERATQKKSKLSIDKDAAGRFIKHALQDKQNDAVKPKHIRFDDQDNDRKVSTDTGSSIVDKNGDETASAGNGDTSHRKRTHDQGEEASSNKPESKRSQGHDTKKPRTHNGYVKHGKHKSSKPPKSSNTVFQNLLNKSGGQSKTGDGAG